MAINFHQPEPEQQPVRFVIIDDEVVIGRDLASQVRSLGYEVAGVASTLAKGTAIVEALRPDIVLIDIQLRSEEDGIDGAQRMRAKFGIPSIYITAYSDANTLLRAQATHPLGYIIKPFRNQELRATLLMAVAQHTLAQALEENQSWLRAVLFSVPDAVVAVDTGGRVRLINPAAERLLGDTSANVEGHHIDQIVRLRDSGLARIGLSSRLPSPAGVAKGKAALIFEEDRQIMVEYTLTNVPCAVRNFEGRLLMLRDITERERVEKLIAIERDLLAGRAATADVELDRTKGELRRLTSELLQAQDAERRRIARELHDDLAQQLAGLGMETAAIAAEFPLEGAVRRELAQLQRRLTAASDFVRTVSHQLHPSTLDDIGLAAALRQMLEDFGEREDAPVRFHSNADALTLPNKISSGIFRIAQEALRNISKHARGAAVKITLSYVRGTLRVSIRDYGPGFDTSAARYRGGLGLVSMLERARAMGGWFVIRSVPRCGTLLTLKVPFPP